MIERAALARGLLWCGGMQNETIQQLIARQKKSIAADLTVALMLFSGVSFGFVALISA